MEFETYRLPPHIEQIPEMQVLEQITDWLVGKLGDALDSADADLRISTSDESGIARRESILKLAPAGDLETRRFIVEMKWFRTEVLTEKYLREQLDELLGAENYSCRIDTKNQTVTMKLYPYQEGMKEAAKSLIDEIIPLHLTIQFGVIFNTWADILKNTSSWGDLTGHTWEYWKGNTSE